MKKNLFLVLCAFVCSLSAFSQASMNVKAGINMSNWSKGDLDMKIGYRAGIGMEYAFGDVFALQPSFLISSKGAKYDKDNIEVKINQVYLELPVMLAAKLRVSDAMNVVLSAGPYVAYGIAGKTKATALGIESSTDTFGDDGLEKLDIGIGAGVAFEISHFILGLDGQWGLRKLGDGTMAETLNLDKTKNVNFGVSVGVKF